MNTVNDGGPAFPVPDSHYADGQVQYGSNGMTLRDWYAGQALAGLEANSSVDMTVEDAAVMAYQLADAMIKAREVKP